MDTRNRPHPRVRNGRFFGREVIARRRAETLLATGLTGGTQGPRADSWDSTGMAGKQPRSYLDLHPHTSYSEEISGELTPYGGILIRANPPLSPVEVALTAARRLSAIAEEEGGGNVFLPIGDLLTPRGAWDLLDAIHAHSVPKQLLSFASRIIPAFEHNVFYNDPFLKRRRRIHFYIVGVNRELYARVMNCDGDLASVVRACDEGNAFFYVAHPLISLNRIAFTREQFEHLLDFIAQARSDKSLPIGVEVRSGKITRRLAEVGERIFDIVEREKGLRFVRVGGSDAYDRSVASAYTSAPLCETTKELVRSLREGNDIRPGGKHGTRTEFEKRVHGLAETKIPAELKNGLNRLCMARLPGYVQGLVDYFSHFAMTFPVFCRFALEDEQIRILSKDYGLPAIEEEVPEPANAAVEEKPSGAVTACVPPALHIQHRRTEASRPGILFLADTPLESEELCRQQGRRHFSGVKSLLDELKKYALAGETPITIGQPSHEVLPGRYEIIRAGNLTLVKFRPSVELYFGDCPTDLPIELTIDLGLALTQAELLERSKLRMLLQKQYRKVQPFSPSHRILRDLIESGAIGPFLATVSIDCGPYAKLAFAEGRGNLDVPTFGIYTTNLADSTLNRMETLYKKIAREITKQPLEEPLSQRAEEVLSHILLPLARFVSGIQTEFLDAVDLLFSPPGNRDDLTKKGITAKIRELGRGLNKEFFKPAEKAPAEQLRLVCAGRIFAENKPGDVIAMMEKLAPDMRSRVFLDVVGDGDERPGLEARLKSLMGSNVTFHGALPQQRVGEIMGRADVSIVAGDYHTYGQVYREGLACGTIQMAKDCFAAKGVIVDYRNSPKNGIGILYRHPKEATQEIARLMSDAVLRKALQSNCQKKAETFPTWADVFDTQLFAPIEEVVRGYRKRNTPFGLLRQCLRGAP